MKKDSAKSTLLVITLGFLLIHLLFEQQWAIYVSLVVGILGAASDWAAGKIEWVWFQLGNVLSKIFPTILLPAIFYLVLSPLAMLSKLFTKDPLQLKNNSTSTFHEAQGGDVRKSMEKTW